MKEDLQLDTTLLGSLGDLPLIARSVVEGFLGGLHRSPFTGYSSEFASYRQYMQGDNLKHVDWKVWGRSDELYVKQFEDDTNLYGQILLDASGSMDFGQPNKFAYGRLLAGALAFLMARQHDAPGLTLFGGETVSAVPPHGSRHQLDEVFEMLAGAVAGGETVFSRELRGVLETMTKRGIAVVITDFFGAGDMLPDLLRRLRVQRQEVLLFQIVSPEEANFDFAGDFLMEDAETGEVVPVHGGPFRDEYLRRFRSFCDDVIRVCGDLEVDHRRLVTDEPLETALTMYFEERMAM